MSAPQYIPSFYFYKFAQGLSTPYSGLEAYKAGAIDSNGNFIKPESSIDPLEYLIIKLKRIFEELPSGMTKAKLGNYMSTLQLFGEEASKFGITDGEYSGLMEGHLALSGFPEISYIELKEDMGVGGMAAPASSPGYNVGAVSGTDPVMGQMQRRGPVLKGMDKCEMFDVCPEELRQFQSAKEWRHVPESDTKKYIRRYQLRNPEGNIALRTVDPDTGEINVHWVPLKPKSLKEENLQETSNNLLEKSGGEVENYQDEYDDTEDNVATKRNSEELPIGISSKELGDTAEIIRSKYEEHREEERISAKKTEATRQARTKMWKKGISGPGYAKEIPEEDIALGMGGAEKYALGTEFESSVGAIPRIIKKLGPRGEELAAQWHGAMRGFAKRDISSHAPVDYVGLPSAEEVEDTDTPWQDLLKRYDAKNIKATSPRRLNPESFAEVEYNGQKGFPKINGVYAYQAQAKAKEDKDEKEVERIQKEILDPFFQNKQVQEIMSSEYRESIAKKIKDAGSQMVLATRPGQRLIPIGDPELQKVFAKGFRPRLVRGGTQPVSKSVLNFQPASNLGIRGVGSKLEQISLPEQNPEVASMLGQDVAKRLGRWLRVQK